MNNLPTPEFIQLRAEIDMLQKRVEQLESYLEAVADTLVGRIYKPEPITPAKVKRLIDFGYTLKDLTEKINAHFLGGK